MKESNFIEIFKLAAEKVTGNNLKIKTKANLLYELFLDKYLKVSPNNPQQPARGNSAFQTDLCVFEELDGILYPRIVIEFKTTITTHDILTYSAKAGKHKTIYPSLRYGLLASEIDKIPNKFFIHNENIDFFIAAKKYKDDQIYKFAKELIEKEIAISQKLDKINFEDNSFDYYRSDLIIDNFIK